MKRWLGLLLGAVTLSAQAQDPAHLKALIEQHRAIAAAHEAAAQCLAAGKKEDDCHAELQKACKGIAIGKLCGLKHKH